MQLSSAKDKQNSAPIAVVGAGNWMVAYDRIGPRVLELVQSRYDSKVRLYNTGSAGLALLDCIHGQDLMLIIDACAGMGPPGEIRTVHWQQCDSCSAGGNVHQIGPVETIKIAEQLFPERLPRKILLILVETQHLTDTAIETACRQVIGIIDQEIDYWQLSHN